MVLYSLQQASFSRTAWVIRHQKG